jgi:hypothetical protein
MCTHENDEGAARGLSFADLPSLTHLTELNLMSNQSFQLSPAQVCCVILSAALSLVDAGHWFSPADAADDENEQQQMNRLQKDQLSIEDGIGKLVRAVTGCTTQLHELQINDSFITPAVWSYLIAASSRRYHRLRIFSFHGRKTLAAVGSFRSPSFSLHLSWVRRI